MTEVEAFNASARRVLELMDGIRVLVRGERTYAERDESYPEDREARFLEQNRLMDRAMRDLAAKFHAVEKLSGEGEKSEARRVVDELRSAFRETMDLVRETRTAVERAKDETAREIRAMGQRENALRAYGANRATYTNGGKGHEDPGTAVY
jgi:hypothetical protein